MANHPETVNLQYVKNEADPENSGVVIRCTDGDSMFTITFFKDGIISVCTSVPIGNTEEYMEHTLVSDDKIPAKFIVAKMLDMFKD